MTNVLKRLLNTLKRPFYICNAIDSINRMNKNLNFYQKSDFAVRDDGVPGGLIISRDDV